MATPHPDLKMIKKVKNLRNKGLSYREIGKLLDRDASQVMRWDRQKLSTLWLDKLKRENKI